MSAILNNLDSVKLPKPIKPDYMKWSKERLQKEYFGVRLELSALKLGSIDDNERVRKAENLIEAIKECLDEPLKETI